MKMHSYSYQDQLRDPTQPNPNVTSDNYHLLSFIKLQVLDIHFKGPAIFEQRYKGYIFLKISFVSYYHFFFPCK